MKEGQPLATTPTWLPSPFPLSAKHRATQLAGEEWGSEVIWSLKLDNVWVFVKLIFTCGVANRSCSCEFPSSIFLICHFTPLHHAPLHAELLTISLVHWQVTTFGDSNDDSSNTNWLLDWWFMNHDSFSRHTFFYKWSESFYGSQKRTKSDSWLKSDSWFIHALNFKNGVWAQH